MKVAGRPRIKELFTDTELTGGKERSMLAVEYQEEKEEKKLREKAHGLGIELDEVDGEESKDLKKLTIKHKFILALYMTGKYSQVDIAKKAEVHYLTVHRVLNSDLGREIIRSWKDMMELEISGLMPLAVDAIRDGLKSGDKKMKLLAVDRFIKMTREDAGSGNININVVNNARTKFITDLKQLAEQEKVLEGEFSQVD